jgi:hypothetical protein
MDWDYRNASEPKNASSETTRLLVEGIWFSSSNGLGKMEVSFCQLEIGFWSELVRTGQKRIRGR